MIMWNLGYQLKLLQEIFSVRCQMELFTIPWPTLNGCTKVWLVT